MEVKVENRVVGMDDYKLVVVIGDRKIGNKLDVTLDLERNCVLEDSKIKTISLNSFIEFKD